MSKAIEADPGASTPLDTALYAVAAVALVVFASPPVALVTGAALALFATHPFPSAGRKLTKILLQTCVVLLGFGMDLPLVLRVGLHGAVFAAVSIAVTLLAGMWLGPRLALDGKTSALIASGTAICGGSAIAAVSSVIAASEAQIAVSIGTVFLLNGVSLYLFPWVGHALHLSQGQFGLWAGVAIHDISSVVGAGMSYGAEALQTATAVKLSRTLWIVPVTLAVGAYMTRRTHATVGGGRIRSVVSSATFPLFIGLFLAASLTRSLVPAVADWSPLIAAGARRGMVLVLFLVGSSLSLRALKAVGWRAFASGVVLWAAVSAATLAVILGLGLAA
jgi:uncharacterized integral membrane protein (TIGR00698 family)